MSLSASSWKVAVSNSDAIIGIFHRRNPSGPTMVLESTEALKAKSNSISFEGQRWSVCRTNSLATLRVPSDYKFWEPQTPEAPTASNS